MIRVALRIAVAVIALALLASRVELAQVGDALLGSAPQHVAIATVAAFVANFVISYRLQVLLAAQGVAARVSQTLVINLTAFFYNLFLPVGGVGIAALRLHRLSREKTGRFTIALTAIVCDRLAAVAALGIVGLVCWIVDPHPKPAGSLLVLLAGLSATVLLVLPRAVPSRVRRIARELQTTGHGRWWSAALARLGHALGSVARFSPSALASILAISVVAQIPGIVVFWAIGASLGLTIPFVSLGWVRSVVVVVALLPISIGGVGVREGILVVMLAAFGVPTHEALAFSILVFATTILAPGLAGGVVEGAQWLTDEQRPASLRS